MTDGTSEFEPGDVVQLKSGGGAMTAVNIESDMVKCVWLDGKRMLREAEFPTHALKSLEASPISLADVLGATKDQK